MHYDRKKDPTAVCAEDGSRYSTTGVGIVKHNGAPYLCATDGRAMTFVDCTPEADDHNDGVYPKEAFAALRTASKGTIASLSLNGAAVVKTMEGATQTFPRIEHRFPMASEVVPKDAPTFVVTLNAEYLARMQKAFGADGLRIEFHGDAAPMKVVPAYLPKGKGKGSPDNSFGILMPIGNDAKKRTGQGA